MLNLTLGDVVFEDVERLARHIEDRGLNGHVEHLGQGHPAQWYLDRLPPKPDERRAASAWLWDAATLLVQRSDEPSVLSMACAICGGSRSEAFFEAVLDRLEGGASPLPEAVRGTVVQMLPAWFPATHGRLGPRVRAFLSASGPLDTYVEALLAADPDGALFEACARAAQTRELTEVVARRVAGALCRGRQEELIDLAERLTPAPTSVREAFRDKVQARDNAWYTTHVVALEQALGLATGT